MRDVYYQSAGNPVQLDRLPASRPDTEMLSPSPPWHERLQQLARLLGYAAALVFGLLSFYRGGGWSFLEPFDLIAGGVAVVVGAGLALAADDLRRALHPLVFAGLGLACMNARIPWGAHIILAAITVGGLTFAFGFHGVAVATAAPLSRTVAAETREQSRCYLLLAAGVAAALTAITLAWDFALARWALGTVVLTLLVQPYPGHPWFDRCKTLRDAWSSWWTYATRPLPGLLQSPCGSRKSRWSLTLWSAGLAALIFVRWPNSPLPNLLQHGQRQIATQRAAAQGDVFRAFRYGAAAEIAVLAGIVALPLLAPLVIASAGALPALLAANAARRSQADENETAAVVQNLRESSDGIERDSIYHGRVVDDGSPVYVPRAVYREHAHGLGDSGSGKTALFLCPLIEQLGSFGDCSILVIDLKADTPELFATLHSVAETVSRTRGVRLPVKYFSNQAGKATFAFNPLTQPFWTNFDLLTRTDILCGANGLLYGTDYGQGYYSAANAAILHHTLKTFPGATTFAELAEGIGTVVATAKKNELHPEIRKAGVHVQEVMKRLAACEALNVTAATGHAAEAVESAIDLAQVFREPQLMYFHLSSTLSPSGAPEIARLVTYMLLAASTQTERRHSVYLVIDEFQRMVAGNLEYILQLARSMGVGVILANQSLEDLKRGTTNLIPAIEANCRLRQWFSVSSSDDQERLMRSSGLTVDHAISRSISVNHEGQESRSISTTEQVVNRFMLNDVLLASDHPFRSILRISRGAGYAQYGGMPVIIESQYHITADEYRRRRAMPWPDARGSFVPGAQRATAALRPPQPISGVQWSEEVIGPSTTHPLSHADQASIEALFREVQQALPAPEHKKKRRRKP